MPFNRRSILTIGGTGLGVVFAGCVGADPSPAAGGDDMAPAESTTEAKNDDADSPESEGSRGSEKVTTRSTDPTVQVRSHPELGPILVGPDKMTLYLFDRDSPDEEVSICTAECAERWPPLTVDGEPTAGDDVTADLTHFERGDGALQVAADGWPLYYSSSDTDPDDATGQGTNDVWWVLRPDGTPVHASEDSHSDHEHDHGHHTEAVDHPVAHAEVAMVSDDGHHFEPHLVWVEPGGTVTWTLESGAHTATAYHPDADRPHRLPDGAPGWNSGLLAEEGTTFERTFETAGIYDYFCLPHEAMGMVGSVIVGHPDPHEQPALESPQPDLPEEAQTVLAALNVAANESLGHTHD